MFVWLVANVCLQLPPAEASPPPRVIAADDDDDDDDEVAAAVKTLPPPLLPPPPPPPPPPRPFATGELVADAETATDAAAAAAAVVEGARCKRETTPSLAGHANRVLVVLLLTVAATLLVVGGAGVVVVDVVAECLISAKLWLRRAYDSEASSERKLGKLVDASVATVRRRHAQVGGRPHVGRRSSNASGRRAQTLMSVRLDAAVCLHDKRRRRRRQAT